MRAEWQGLTRRGVFRMAAAAGFAGLGRLYASNSDFWNKKDPAEWTGAEVDQLTNKSPWAKEVSVTAPAQGGMNRGGGYPGGGGGYPGGGGGYPGGGGGYPGGGGIGFPGGGMGRRRGGQMPGQTYKAIVRWESAKPILDALKAPLPEGFADHYVISVGGIPLDAGSRGRYESNDDSQQSAQAQLDRMKGYTYLQPKDKRDLQPGIIVQQPTGYGNVYFGFAKDLVTLRPEDKEVTFTTSFGVTQVKTRFNLKDMLYHGELAV